ncbi:MAG: GWxTD domain-containing protein [Bacteroidales bacterium]|nr:GWxTD domain-containing protein [Bacteroidales bacterium]MBN2819257.1 GWxTD domain-containing protein [Bacteroidales bacterium]
MKVFRANKIILVSIGIVLLAIIVSCTTSYNTYTNRWNLAAIYNPSRSSLHPSYKIYHNATETSILFFKIFTSELAFQPVGNNGEWVSKISLNYTLTKVGENPKAVADSGTIDLSISKKGVNKFYISQVPIKVEMGGSYRLKLLLRDELKRNFNLHFLDIEKIPEYGQQFFNLTNANGYPIFKNVIIGDGFFRILHASPGSEKLFISYYKTESPLPKPTFAVDMDQQILSKPDSLYIIPYDPATSFSLAYDGRYFIQFDTTKPEGLTLLKFNEDFPKITTPEDLVKPLAYITTSGEYRELTESGNLKLAIDNFWINASGSTDRGREMIRIYYNRVYFANYYFTSTREGWKTDRGMVYIVYGPPHNLKKTTNTETWYYYNKKGGEDITFNFDYNPSKYAVNEYRLLRSESNTWHWREAVYAWTSGEIFLQN